MIIFFFFKWKMWKFLGLLYLRFSGLLSNSQVSLTSLRMDMSTESGDLKNWVVFNLVKEWGTLVITLFKNEKERGTRIFTQPIKLLSCEKLSDNEENIFHEEIMSDCSNFLLGQVNMLCEWEKNRWLGWFNIVLLHSHTVHLTKYILTEINWKLYEETEFKAMLHISGSRRIKSHWNQSSSENAHQKGKTGGVYVIKWNKLKSKQDVFCN